MPVSLNELNHLELPLSRWMDSHVAKTVLVWYDVMTYCSDKENTSFSKSHRKGSNRKRS